MGQSGPVSTRRRGWCGRARRDERRAPVSPPGRRRAARDEGTPELEREERIAARRLDDPAQQLAANVETEPLEQQPPGRREAERADVEPFRFAPLQHPLEVGRDPGTPGEQNAHRLAVETPRGESQCLGRGGVLPLEVVHRDEQGPETRERTQHVEEPERDRKRLGRARRPARLGATPPRAPAAVVRATPRRRFRRHPQAGRSARRRRAAPRRRSHAPPGSAADVSAPRRSRPPTAPSCRFPARPRARGRPHDRRSPPRTARSRPTRRPVRSQSEYRRPGSSSDSALMPPKLASSRERKDGKSHFLWRAPASRASVGRVSKYRHGEHDRGTVCCDAVALSGDYCAYGCAYRLVSGGRLLPQFVATTNWPICRIFRLGAIDFSLFGRTFNPKVAGSTPARPMRFAGILPHDRGGARADVRTRTCPGETIRADSLH
jgi:hypothetical protein